jgi:hypothetical protein
MSFPQPNLSTPLLIQQNYARLQTPLQSPGDIYESEVSFKAVALGPQSDLARVRVTYLDPIAPSSVASLVVTPQYPFPADVFARLDQSYPLSATKARVLISSDDVYDPNFRPSTFVAGDAIQFVAPVLDMMLYYSPPSGQLPQARGDKSYFFQYYPVPGGKVFWLVVPFYGRKYANAIYLNREAATPIMYGILGVNFSTTDKSPTYHEEKVIRAAAAVAPNAVVPTIVKASVDGMFDALVFSFDGAGPAPLKIIVSDNAL